MHFTFFFFNDTATTEIYTLSLHDALPICRPTVRRVVPQEGGDTAVRHVPPALSSIYSPSRGEAGQRIEPGARSRSEEHTSELQSQSNLVCRLLLEKKKKKRTRR